MPSSRPTPRRSLIGNVAFALALSAAVAGCRERQPKPLIEHVAVVRCERGAERATSAKTLDEAMSILYRACSDIHAQKLCADAFVSASTAPLGEQMKVAADGCTKAYCTMLGGDRHEICRADFQATPNGLMRAWPPFHEAIIQHDARGLAPRINNALLSYYMTSQKLSAQAPPAPEKAEDAGAPTKKKSADAGKKSADAGKGTPASPTKSASEKPKPTKDAPEKPKPAPAGP
jgi:hypothetical protein